jgi:hypothetical protein
MNFGRTVTTYSDNSGNLLFYTNGIYIENGLGEQIENSDSLNAGYIQFDWDPLIHTHGYRLLQGILAIKSINNPQQYYLIHSLRDKVRFSNDFFTSSTLVTLLDMSENQGHGKVLYKNKPIVSDSLGFELQAVRHGNGRDWWVLVQKRNTNCFYRLLIDAAGVHLLPELTCGGDTVPNTDAGTVCFSPDGSKYVYLGVYAGLNIYNFDRCNGTFNNAIHLPIPALADSFWYGLGASISSNNRFLYVSVTKELYQFDLEAADVFSNIDTVGVYDGYRRPFGSYFVTSQMAPDGKIYMSCGNGEAVWHVINNPDALGDSCDFQQHGIRLPSYCNSVPNFPNYRLGALPGSPCDTLTGLDEVARAEKERVLKVFPNPATDIITIDYGFTDWSKTGEVDLEIVNDLGQIVYTQPVPRYSGFQKIEVVKFTAGLYTAYIKRNNALISAAKFAKE